MTVDEHYMLSLSRHTKLANFWTSRPRRGRPPVKFFNRDIFAYRHKVRKEERETTGAFSGSPDNTSKKLLAALCLLNQLALHQVYTYTVLKSRILTL